MIFHVAGAADPALALEFLEQFAGRLAENVDQHVQPAPVRHADNDFLYALGAGLLHQLIHHRNQTVAAFQRKALLTDIAGMQITLQPLGGHQPVQQLLALRRSETQPGALAFQPLLNPALFRRLIDVHVFGADGAYIDITDQAQNLAQGPL